MSAINVWNRNTERVADRLSRDSEKVTVHCPIRNMLRVGQDADRQALTLLRNDSNRLSPKRRTSVARNPGIQENVRVPTFATCLSKCGLATELPAAGSSKCPARTTFRALAL